MLVALELSIELARSRPFQARAPGVQLAFVTGCAVGKSKIYVRANDSIDERGGCYLVRLRI